MRNNDAGNFWKVLVVVIAVGAIVVCLRQESVQPIREWIDMPVGEKFGEAVNWLFVGGLVVGLWIALAAVFRR